MRRQFAIELALQGFLGGLLALALVAVGMALFGHVSLTLPASLPGENPVEFATGGFRAALARVPLPISATLWDWLLPPRRSTDSTQGR